MLAEEIRVNAITIGIGANPCQGCGHGFLHDFTKVSGHGELLSTAHACGFDEDDVSADGRPYQTDRDARLLNALFDFFFGPELRHAEIFTDDLRSDQHLVHFAFGNSPSLFTSNGSNLALEVSNAGFASETVNNFANGVVAEFQLL